MLHKILLTTLLFSTLAFVTPTRAADAPPAATAPMSDDKAAEIRKMLRVTGMEKLMNQMMAQMISSFKTNQTGLPEEFWNRLQKNMDTKELILLIVPLYDKYYTVDDLKTMNAFYESSTGQKVLSTLPQLMQESMKIGQQWGERVGRRVEQEITDELKKKKAAKDL